MDMPDRLFSWVLSYGAQLAITLSVDASIKGVDQVLVRDLAVGDVIL